MLLAGAALAALFWVGDSLIDSWFFSSAGFLASLWPDDGRELWMRFVIVALIFSLAAYAERAVRRSREDAAAIHSLMEHTTDAYVVVDRDWHITYFNARAEALFGRARAATLDRTLWELFPDAEAGFQSPFRRCAALQESAAFDGHHAGLNKWLEIHAHPAADGLVFYVHDQTERRRANEALKVMSNFDVLTGLPNRALLRDRLEHGIQRARREKQRVVVMLLDLDRFKNVNDSLGHDTGNMLIKTVAQRLKKIIRECDTVARLGGDEFAIILEDIQSKETISHAAQRVLQSLQLPIKIDDLEIGFTACIGIAIYPEDAQHADDLLQNADTAMYRAKRAGRNLYQFYTIEMNKDAVKRLSLEQSLRHALLASEFELYYQPQIDLAAGTVIGAEALLRWRHPEHGLVPPGEFIPLLEESGLILPVGEWVIRQACAQLQAWRAQGLPPLRVAVNLSAVQFRQQDLLSRIVAILKRTGADPAALELEITEGVLVENVEEAVVTLSQIHAMGIKISIDDFGTGYSSLSYLKRFPLHTLKIDQSFIRDINRDADSTAIAMAIIAMAHALRLHVIAEGVEAEEQLRLLKAEGCDEAQGFLFSRPLPAEEFASWLRERLRAVRRSAQA